MICWKLIIRHSFRSNTMASGFMVQVYYVEGLTMGKERFVWNDRLIFTDAGAEHGNIAEVRVFIDKEIHEISEFTSDSETTAESMHLVTIFLACFHLVNENTGIMLVEDEAFGYSVNSFEDFKTGSSGMAKDWSDGDWSIIPEKYTLNYLTNTVPLFEKVIKNMNFKQKNQKKPACHHFALLPEDCK